MLEVETKFRLNDPMALLKRLGELGAIQSEPEQHADSYYRHPCRDFVKTKEALRIRSIDSIASVTYKGPKMDLGDSALKARQEIEWCLAPGDADGNQMEQLLIALGFSTVTTVHKRRQSYRWPVDQAQLSQFTVTVDEVEQVGTFAEIELLISEQSQQQVELAGRQIDGLAQRLGLSERVHESYLQLLLNLRGEG